MFPTDRRLCRSESEGPHNYPPNTAVILFNSARDLNVSTLDLVCHSRGNQSESRAPAQVDYAYSPTFSLCKWMTYLATCQVESSLLEFSLGTTQPGDGEIEIPFQLPYTKKQVDVGVCYSPFFYAEYWQLALTMLELNNHFGIHLQVIYVQSILEDFMKVLENKTMHKIKLKLKPKFYFELEQT
ncbi:glycosyltransferase family 92 domain-containing protein [Ditylenchus destructor]|uniref:Glycosyltransferase family 92 protein n=1 Tax=Ditylenchus destructor TaxID=166010 RepID=A0AAD4QSL9_9BILA|nr:glycosyltransferase family 92 domain-containing protein [Ditylenchus destructor]